MQVILLMMHQEVLYQNIFVGGEYRTAEMTQKVAVKLHKIVAVLTRYSTVFVPLEGLVIF